MHDHPVFFEGLVRFIKRPTRVGHASEMRDTFERAPRTVAIGHQRAGIAFQEGLRILLPTAGLVFKQHHGLGTFLGTAVDPHVRLALRALAIFLWRPGLSLRSWEYAFTFLKLQTTRIRLGIHPISSDC